MGKTPSSHSTLINCCCCCCCCWNYFAIDFVILILWIISLFKICISNSIEEQTDSFRSSLVSFMNILPKEKFLSVRYRKKRNKKLCANGRNNSHNYVANNVGSCCVRDGSGVQTRASTLNNVGTCSSSWEGYNS